MYTCNLIYVNPRNETKKGGPRTTFRDRGQKSTPLGLYILLRKAMRRNCTTILRNTKSNAQKSGNIRKGEVINTPGCYGYQIQINNQFMPILFKISLKCAFFAHFLRGAWGEFYKSWHKSNQFQSFRLILPIVNLTV